MTEGVQEESAQAEQVGTSARHIHPGCECRIVEFPDREVEEIIGNVQQPILGIEPTDTDKIGVIAKPWDGETKYVVVWNRLDDEVYQSRPRTITSCRLIRLAILLGKLQVEEVKAELCFWLQAVCEPECSGHSRMARVYEDAYAVMVVDSTSPEEVGYDTVDSYVSRLRDEQPLLLSNERVLLTGPFGYVDMLDSRGGSEL